ncbi:phosphodiester glycosidase family protein [Novosphingobium tardum]|uniref:Phosphodiester glycosidase family protein n=1 Tax=Novosphingobium tardum TaxID=1538021 RepID=A0ABV8RTD5_9SPHN
MAMLPLGACGDSGALPDRSNTSRVACVAESFEGSDFIHCTARPGRNSIRTVLNGPSGQPLRDLGRLAETMGTRAQNVVFAMNGGIYDEVGQPIGYYVEDGKRLHKLNRAEGGGNFGLVPNGVFSVEADGWHVRSADSFAREVKRRPQYATQSEPMLVISGKLHPRIAENGESLHIRNGVGVDAKGRAHFVISESAVSFGRIARYFRDRLGCPNALYLDGSVSSLWDPASERIDRRVPLGPLLVVEKADAAASHPRERARMAAPTSLLSPTPSAS